MKRPHFRTLQGRIFAFFFALLFVMQLGSILITSSLGYAIAEKMLGEELQTSKLVFIRLFDQNIAFLTQGARILASDYGFREAIGSSDADTIISALDNHSDRIEADLMLFIGLDGKTYSSTHTRQIDPARIGSGLGNAKGQNDQTALIKRIDGELYQLIAVTVAAPLRIGTIIAGFRIDTALAKDIGNITHTDVSFIGRDRHSAWRIHASTLGRSLLDATIRSLDTQKPGSNGIQEFVHKVETPAGSYLSLYATLPSPDGQVSGVVLQKSLNATLAPFLDLRDQLIILGVIALLFSGLFSLGIARSVTQPIRTLTDFARQLAEGRYPDNPVVASTHEIAELADSLGHMSREIAARESQILHLAYTDTLTGLPNRTLFHERAQLALDRPGRASTPLTIMLMDLDHFRYVNDSLGHHIGDLLLQEVAQRLLDTVNPDTDTVAHLGGDEFAVLLPTACTQRAGKMAQAILAALEKPMVIEDQVIDIRGSIGAASAPQHGSDVSTLLRCADIAMYQAKRSNAGYAEYDPILNSNTPDRLSLLSELQEAIADNQLTLYYQPKVDLQTRPTLAVEALVRWMHPTRGFVPPDSFIPFAEQTGYIKAITYWVLNEGVRQCAAWQRAGLDISISINISARDLMNADLPLHFASLLHLHHCPPERICLEITESAILHDPAQALENLNRLRVIGCTLSVDDYGTGYSSLAYLKRLPVSELKIDRSFVQNMTEDSDDTVIVRSTIDLAHNLGLQVVAEGVETAAILSLLCQLGCDRAQGYHFSRPVSASDYVAWLATPDWQTQVQAARSA